MVICFKYFGFLARTSSKLKSSGGCIIFEVAPPDDIIGGGLDISGNGANVEPPALFVVGGALIVAELWFI